eukprot:5906109-Lingulodinium_polyedra.AAC.1
MLGPVAAAEALVEAAGSAVSAFHSGVFDACPPCGLGEAGSERLLLWCPAVQAAWETCSGLEQTVVTSLRVRTGSDAVLAR